MSYYKDQINRINPKSEYGATIKITDGDTTKFLNLNNESANVLVQWLKENFDITDSETTERMNLEI